MIDNERELITLRKINGTFPLVYREHTLHRFDHSPEAGSQIIERNSANKEQNAPADIIIIIIWAKQALEQKNNEVTYKCSTLVLQNFAS